MVFRVKHWNYLFLEGYCFINSEYDRKHSKYMYEFIDKEYMKTKKILNKDHDPLCKPNKKPKKCTGHINIDCVKCKYLAYTSIEDKLKEQITETVNKFEYEDEELENGGIPEWL